MVVEQKREADSGYVSFWDVKMIFLRVALSSYEANVTFLFRFGCIEANASCCEPGLAVRVELRTSER